MNILVINPPSPEKSYMNRDLMGGMGVKVGFGKSLKTKLISKLKSNLVRIPVMQLVYVATILQKNHNVRVIDAANQNMSVSDILPVVKGFRPDYVFMAVSSSGVIFERDVVAKKIKKAAPKSVIVTIGDTIPFKPSLLRDPFDVAIMGEAERPSEKIADGEKLSRIKGIIYRKGKMVIKNKKEDLMGPKDLDNLPFPEWSLFDYRSYSYFPMIMKKPVVTVLSSRGCPFGCIYCSYSKNMGLRWRARSADNVVDEIARNVKKYGIKGVIFRDPLFSADMKRVERICEEILKRKIKVSWSCETRPELLTKSLLQKMRKAGCSGINLGIESISPDVLKQVGRKEVDPKSILNIVTFAEKLDIRTSCFFMMGLPGSTRKSISDDIRFSRQLNASHVEYKITTPFPGTELYDRAKKNGWIKSARYEDLGGYSATMQVSDDISPGYLENVCNQAFKGYYSRPKYIIRELTRKDIFAKISFIARGLLKSIR